MPSVPVSAKPFQLQFSLPAQRYCRAGNLNTKQLLIEVGAQFTGKCSMGQQSTVAMPKQKIG